jgi:hypothetical protein
MSDKKWISVPDALRPSWEAIFRGSRGGVDVVGTCPVCGKNKLHRYYQVGRPIAQEIDGEKYVARGGLWEWCSACHSYEHSSALVPDWWKSDLRIDESRLTAIPDALEAAIQARGEVSSAMPGMVETLSAPGHALSDKTVQVVELREYDGTTETTVARFVLTPGTGQVSIIGCTKNGARTAETLAGAGVPGAMGRTVTRDAGIEYLRLLRENFRGSRLFATDVFEMAEQEAMTGFSPPGRD